MLSGATTPWYCEHENTVSIFVTEDGWITWKGALTCKQQQQQQQQNYKSPTTVFLKTILSPG